MVVFSLHFSKSAIRSCKFNLTQRLLIPHQATHCWALLCAQPRDVLRAIQLYYLLFIIKVGRCWTTFNRLLLKMIKLGRILLYHTLPACMHPTCAPVTQLGGPALGTLRSGTLRSGTLRSGTLRSGHSGPCVRGPCVRGVRGPALGALRSGPCARGPCVRGPAFGAPWRFWRVSHQ